MKFPSSRVTKGNLEYWFKLTTTTNIQTGLNWYKNCYNFCDEQAKRFNIPVEKAIAIYAVLSPYLNEKNNRIALVRILTDSEKIPGFPANIKKAKLINSFDLGDYKSNLKGKGRAWTNVLNTIGTNKVFNFFYSIYSERGIYIDYLLENVDAGQIGMGVAIDRWMLKAAYSTERPQCLGMFKVSDQLYYQLAENVIELAEKYEITPSQCQAIIWESIRTYTDYRNKQLAYTRTSELKSKIKQFAGN